MLSPGEGGTTVRVHHRRSRRAADLRFWKKEVETELRCASRRSPRLSSSGSDGDTEDDGQPPARRRGRTMSRRGAQNRGGSILCRLCGKRGYGSMKMVLACCSKAVNGRLNSTLGVPSSYSGLDSSSSSVPALCRVVDDDLVVEVGTPPVLDEAGAELLSAEHLTKYRWSPCSSRSSDSSSTISDVDVTEGGLSSGHEADAEGATLPCPSHVRALAPRRPRRRRVANY